MPRRIAFAVMLLLAASRAEAQCASGVCYAPAARYAPAAPSFAWPYRAAPRVTYTQAYSPAPPTAYAAPATPEGGGALAALAVINAERARYGRGPLAWSASLAAYASTNSGVHAPGSNGGAGQCWAGVGDAVQAAYMWLNSPPHRAILLGAQSECGISSCPTGMTANAR